MEYISDIFLGTAAISAALYCLLLSRRLSRLRGLDQDLGGAIALLSKQVDDMTHVLREAQTSAEASSEELRDMAERAEIASNKMEEMFAAMQDFQEATTVKNAPVVAENEAPVATPDQPLFRSRGRSNGVGMNS